VTLQSSDLYVTLICSFYITLHYITLHVSNYFYCHIRPEGPPYHVERDLLAIAKFLLQKVNVYIFIFIHHNSW